MAVIPQASLELVPQSSVVLSTTKALVDPPSVQTSMVPTPSLTTSTSRLRLGPVRESLRLHEYIYRSLRPGIWEFGASYKLQSIQPEFRKLCRIAMEYYALMISLNE